MRQKCSQNLKMKNHYWCSSNAYLRCQMPKMRVCDRHFPFACKLWRFARMLWRNGWAPNMRPYGCSWHSAISVSIDWRNDYIPITASRSPKIQRLYWGRQWACEAQNTVMRFLAAGGIGLLGYEIHKMRTSVETLNEKMGELLERSRQHERQLERHEDRLEHLENGSK